MYISDATTALRLIAARLRPGGIVAFLESADAFMPTSQLRLPVLGSLWDVLRATYQRSGARLEIGSELYGRMLDAGLEPDPLPLAEIVLYIGDGEVGFRRWSTMAQNMLPKIVEYGAATQEEVLDTIDRLRTELCGHRGPVPVSWFTIGQWARKPASATPA